jgi:hypothetical protein
MKTLRECLADYDTVLLRAIAERLGVAFTTNHHAGMVEEIAQALLEGNLVSEVLGWLSHEERLALETLLSNGGRMRAHRFVQRFGNIRRFGPGSMAREAPWRTPVSPAEGLWYRGLISRAFAKEADVVVEFFFVPSDLRELLPPPQSEHKPFVVPLADEPYTVAAGDPALVDDLCTLLAQVQNERVRAKSPYQLPEELARIEERFLGSNGPRLVFLYHLARAMGFVYSEGRVLKLDRERVRDWLKQPRAEQLWRLQETWSKDVDWDDLRQVPSIRCEETGWRGDPVATRDAVLGLLNRSEADAWLSIEGFVNAIHDQVPDYARPDGDFDSWYIRDARSGEYVMGFDHWYQVEGALLVYLISGPIYWLGMVSLGYREGWEKPSSFRLTPWGMAFLGFAEAPVPEELSSPAAISPEGVVTLSRAASLHDRFQLARIAEWLASGEEYVYAVTPASLGKALSTNVTVEMVERFLQRIAQGNVPAAAIARLRSWAGNYGHVRLQRATVLETRTPQLMSELRAHERIRPYLRQALSPTLVIVRDSDWSRLIEELHLAGYLPEIVE